MKCRHCAAPLKHTFMDLGFAPLSNSYLSNQELTAPETYYPLRVKVCEKCWLVQTDDFTVAEDHFGDDYAYFSSTSHSWLEHSRQYAEMITARLGLDRESLVIEVASNDGYLLKNFVASEIPCLGIEPTRSTATEAEKLGIPVLQEFFTEELGNQLAGNGKQADLIAGNNVYAHVPDINDFTKGLKAALKPGGTITLEFPHLYNMLHSCQFDTIYHEHFSYLSLHVVQRIFAGCDLRIFDVEEIETHGGSLRIYGCHQQDIRTQTEAVSRILKNETDSQMQHLVTYQRFQARADKVKNDLLKFLIQCKEEENSVAAYGAAAKGNTLLNYAGVKPDLLPLVYDAAKAKQGMFMPGSHIPIRPAGELASNPPNYLLILPWNIAEEVMKQNKALRDQGTRFVRAVPELEIL